MAGVTTNFFFLVFDIPRSSYGNLSVESVVRELSSQKMTGVVGVSNDSRIVGNFLQVARNTMLIMPAQSLMSANQVRPIQYNDAESLVRNNLADLKRLWMKTNPTPYQMEQTMGTLVEYSYGAGTKFDYGGSAINIGQRAGKYMQDNNVKVNSVRELGMAFKKALEEEPISKNWNYSHTYEIWKEYFAKNSVEEWFRGGLRLVSKVYSDEGEWVNEREVLNIPNGSKLVITDPLYYINSITNKPKVMASSYDKTTLTDYIKWKTTIQTLRSKYQITFVDDQAFEKTRSQMLDRRYKRLEKKK